MQLSLLEILGALTGAICVYFVLKRNIWNFAFGIASGGFYTLFFFEHKLYWEMVVQFVLIAISGLGWYWWARRAREGEAAAAELPVTRASRSVLVFSFLTLTAAMPVMTWLSHLVGGNAPFFDSLIASLSLVAQTLLGRKMIENWGFWIVADLIAIPLYFSRGMYLTGLLYLLFLGLCIGGLLEWRRDLDEQRQPSFAT